MNPDQVFLSMSQYAQFWIEIPLVYLREGNDSIRKIIGVDSKLVNAPFIAFFDEKGIINYLPIWTRLTRRQILTNLKRTLSKQIKK